MKFLVHLFAVVMALELNAQQVPIRRSQRFTVLDARPVDVTSPGRLKSASGEDLTRLDPDVLLLSAERIREALLWELALPAREEKKVRLVLYPAQHADDLIGLGSAYSTDGWSYELDVPDQVESQKVVRGVVGVLLLDVANQGQGPKSAELPLWLVEGLTLQVGEVAGRDLVVGAIPLGSMLRTVRERQGLDYLKTARTVLRSQPLLSFSELAHPHPATIEGNRLSVYQYSAQFFVYQLLHAEQGPAKLVTFLRDLPKCWNWETALLHAYAADFRTLLDVEKRWSVDVLAFTALDPTQVRSKVALLEQLDAVLEVPARVHRAPNELPERTTLTLQQVIADWDFAAQAGVLQNKLGLLASLRPRATPDVLPLIDGYQRALASYLQRRVQAGRTPEKRMQVSYNASLVAEDAIRELGTLDKRRKALQPEQSLSVNSTISFSR